MFESLKKKFSRTSEKLEEELIEEAKNEDNLQEEKGSRFSFFSFGNKKESPEETKNDKSHLWSRNKSDDEKNDESDEKAQFENDDVQKTDVLDDDKSEKKSRFWSRNKSDDESVDVQETDVLVFGVETNLQKILLMVKQQEDYFHLSEKKPYKKNILKTSYGN